MDDQGFNVDDLIGEEEALRDEGDTDEETEKATMECAQAESRSKHHMDEIHLREMYRGTSSSSTHHEHVPSPL